MLDASEPLRRDADIAASGNEVASKSAGKTHASARPRLFRSITLGLLIGLLAVSLLVSIRATPLFFPSRQPKVHRIDPIKPKPGFAERLGNALRFPTFITREAKDADRAPFIELSKFLEEEFPAVHRQLLKEVFEDHTLLFRWKGTDSSIEPIMLMSHLDVVPAEEGTEKDWTHPPFGGKVVDGFIWGRGALDVKSGALGLLEAAELLLDKGFRPAGDIYFALGHDEETRGSGNGRIASTLAERGIRLRFVLDEGGSITEGIISAVPGPVAFIGIAEKGYAMIHTTAEAAGGHSSMPPPHTAVGMVSAAITALEANPFPARIDGATAAMLDYLGPEMSWPNRVALANRWLTTPLIHRQFSAEPSMNPLIRTTMAATVIRGGNTQNVLPKRAEAYINLRLLPGDTSELALKRVESVVRTLGFDSTALKCTLGGAGMEPSPISPVDSDEFKTLQRTILEIYPGTIVTPGLSMVATDSRQYAKVAVNIYRFLPVRLAKEDLKRIHGVDERIDVKTYEEMIGFLARLIENLTTPLKTTE